MITTVQLERIQVYCSSSEVLSETKRRAKRLQGEGKPQNQCG